MPDSETTVQRLDGVRGLIERYCRAGITSIAYDFYPGGRHEMLNEINRNEVRANQLDWISALCTR
jgi:alpha-beta hydrolase superfamily lysophospholipase